MSYANGTQFYNLPQTVGTDKRDWFDTNSPFAAIDAALHAAVVGQASDAEAIATINSKLATDEADIAALQTKGNTHDSQIAALQTTVNTQASQIQDVRQDAEDMITANNEGAAATSTRAYAIGDYFIYNDVLYKATAAIAVGDTIVPNTNCEATNVDTELTQVNNDLAEMQNYKTIRQVTGDSNTTLGQLCDKLFGSDVLNHKYKLITYNANTNVYTVLECHEIRSNYKVFSCTILNLVSSTVNTDYYILATSGSSVKQDNGGTISDISNVSSANITLQLVL